MNKKIKKSLIVGVSIGTILLLSGCSNKQMNAEVMDETRGLDMVGSQPILNKHYNEVINGKKYVSVETSKTIKQVLEELGEIEGKIYFLDQKSKNMLVPTSKYKVTTFKDFNNYIKSVSNHVLIITKNKYVKGMPKVVKVVQKAKIKNSLKNVKMDFWNNSGSGLSASDALSIVADRVGYSVILKQEDFVQDGKNTTVSTFLKNTKINFRGRNVKDFLDYIESSYDVFVDVDYGKKVITIGKYQTKFYKLVPPNLDLESTDEDEGSSSTGSTGGMSIGGTGTTEQTRINIEQKIKIETYKGMRDKLEKVFKNKNQNIYYSLNDENGELIVNGDSPILKRVSRIVENFNTSFTSEFRLRVYVYEVLVTRGHNLGVNLDAVIKSAGDMYGVALTTAGNAPSITDSGFSFSKTTNSGTASAFVDALSQYGTVMTANGIDEIATNNMPIPINLTQTDEYVSAIQQNILTGTVSNQTTVSNTNSIATSGVTMTIMPKLVGENVFLQIDYKQQRKPTLVDQKIGDNEIKLATDYGITAFKKYKKMKLGDTRLYSVVKYDQADLYKGIVPIQNFVIGGSTNKQKIRREILIFVQTAPIQ